MIKQHSNKTIPALLMAGMGLLVIFCFIIHWNHSRIRPFTPPAVTHSDLIPYKIDEINWGEYITIYGSVFSTQGEPHIIKNYLVLKDHSTDLYYQIPTKMRSGDGYNEIYNSDFDLTNSGLYGKVAALSLNEDTVYEICISYQSDNHNYFVETGIKLRSGGPYED